MGGGRDKAEEQVNAISKLSKFDGYKVRINFYGNYDEEELYLETASEALEQYPEEMDFYMALYTFYFNTEEYEKATDIATQQLANNDTTAVIYLHLGNSLQREEKFNKAYDAYEAGLKLDADFHDFWYQLGRLTAVSKSNKFEGEKYLKKLFEIKESLDPLKLTWSHFQLGVIYENNDDIEGAKAQYQMALAIDENHAESKSALNRLK